MNEHETIQGRDMADVTAELEALCRAHGMGIEQIEVCRDLDALLVKLVEDEEGAPLDEPDPGGDRRQHERLHELVRVAGAAAVLNERAAGRAALERHEAEIARLRDAVDELLQALAQLAHKMNNPLTSLLGRAQILQMGQGTDPRVQKAAGVIEESARRVAADVQQLATLVKQSRERLLEG